MEPNNSKINFLIAQNRVKDLRKFYISLGVFVVINLIITARHYYKFGTIEFSVSHSLIMAIWAIFLMIRGASLFVFNQDWERKKLEEFLNK